METTQHSHNERILDQFTKQAVPFAEKAEHSREDTMQLTLETTGVTPNDTVLDVACGPGLVACAFANVARHVTGIDIVPAMIEQARQRQIGMDLVNMDWVVGDILPLPFGDGSFSLVLSRYAFHHILDPAAVLREMARVCAPGGRVAVIDFDMDPAKSAAFDHMEQLRDPSHVHALSLPELREMASAAGLTGLREAFYGVPMEVEQQLAASSPHPGDGDRFRRVFRDDVGVNNLGVDAHVESAGIHYTYPIAILVGEKPV
jgi:ubiquinone/menaquinone biosynthesis C-methylase UbiE